jgi:hypothetical protein
MLGSTLRPFKYQILNNFGMSALSIFGLCLQKIMSHADIFLIERVINVKTNEVPWLQDWDGRRHNCRIQLIMTPRRYRITLSLLTIHYNSCL